MKKYKIIYFEIDCSNPSYLAQLSKTGKKDGASISFLIDGRKLWQNKYKNNLRNGLDKDWLWKINPKNNYFTNWKKYKWQGLDIRFKR